ncbi:MAG TPA: hypothetical protein VEG63_11565 [Candidatus Acidoferrales bacterium]|nr:hypothetical protein [Candidatus Acidoferrales bacterium]
MAAYCDHTRNALTLGLVSVVRRAYPAVILERVLRAAGFVPTEFWWCARKHLAYTGMHRTKSKAV